MSSQAHSSPSSHFTLFVLLPFIIVMFLLYEAWMWLQANGGQLWNTIHGWVIGIGIVLFVAGAIWLTWRIYHGLLGTRLDREELLGRQHHNLIAKESHELLKEARLNHDNVDVAFTDEGSIASLKIIRAREQANHIIIQELQQKVEELQQLTSGQLQLEAPDQEIPDVVNYDDVADEVPFGMSLLGIHPQDGSLELTNYERLKCLWIVGSSSSGKSNTVSGKVREAVEKGAKLLVIDQHAEKDDSLARKLAPYQAAFLRPVAVTDEDVLDTFAFFKQEFEERVQGGPREQKIVLVADELNRMNRNNKLKKALQEIVFICGEEARGFNMFGWFISQKCAGLKWLRDSAITVIVHKLTRFEEALLACNDDRKAAKQLLTFKIGRTFVYGVDFDEPMVLQQPLYKILQSSIVESNVPYRTNIELSGRVPSNQSVIDAEQFYEPQERAQEADGTNTQMLGTTPSFELKKLLNEIGQLKAKGKSNAEILKHYELHPGGRNNTNLSALIGLIGDDTAENS